MAAEGRRVGVKRLGLEGRAPPWRCRVRLVRGEGRGVSDSYGVRDAACPISTRGGGGGGGG